MNRKEHKEIFTQIQVLAAREYSGAKQFIAVESEARP